MHPNPRSAGSTVQIRPAVSLHAALTTIKIHAPAVEPGYQRHLISTALLSHVIATARHAAARISYGQFDTSTPALAVSFRHCGVNLAEPGVALDLDVVIDVPAIIAALPGHTLIHQGMNQ